MDILSYILGKKAGGGGGEAVLVNKDISANGTYNASADSADGYKKVVVDVPNTYAAGDEGKVVSNGALVSQTSASYTTNGTYDTTLISEVEVDVPSGITELYDHALPSGSLHTDATTLYNISVKTAVTHVDAPNATKIEQEAFKNWTALETAYLPKVNNTNSHYLFEGCTALEGLVLPAIDAANYNNMVAMHNMCKNCTNMEYFDAFFSGFNGWDTFVNDAKLKTVILRKNGVCSLGDIKKFNSTPFASGGTGGTLYVPSAQISSYQAATNWSTILGYANNQIKAIEGSIYETQYADGTPIS